MLKAKILLVGAFSRNPSIYTYATSFASALSKLGYTIEQFNYRNHYVPQYFSYLNHVLCNNALISKAHAFKPDLIFIIKGENITAHTIATIKKKLGCSIINFYPDNPFALWNGNSNHEILKRLPLLDCYLSWSTMLIEPLQSAGCKHVCHFPFAYDHDLFEKEITYSSSDYSSYTADVTFVGTWEPEREWWLNNLVQRLPSLSLAIWGNDWHKNCHSLILKKHIRGNAIYNDAMIKAFRLSKIVLNFIRTQNLSSHNMRTIEVPASKAFLLTQRTPEQAQLLFVEGTHLECFGTIDELVQKITFYCTNDKKRNIITHNGYQQAKKFTLQRQLENYLNHYPLVHKQG